MNSIGLLKVATSTLILGSVMFAGGTGIKPNAIASTVTAKQADRMAAQLYKTAQTALSKGKVADAVANSEKMVRLVPNDARYRQFLGESYLAAGRFQSAETALNDSLELSPGNEKVALKLALVMAALGKQQPAQNLLRQYEGSISGTDYGLALALAGDTAAAIPVLETVVRSPSSDARARQNLALVYAMSSRWLEARTVAAQDLSPDLLDRRITEWAGFVRPKGSWDQVASLLGVKPAYDAGQPTALALAPSQNGAVLAAAEPVNVNPVARFETVEPAEQAEPITNEQAAIAAAEPVQVYKPVETEAAPVFEMAARPKSPKPANTVPLVKSAKNPVKSALSGPKPKPKAPASASVKAAAPKVAPVKTAKSETGKFVVQLAASNDARALSNTWSSAVTKVAALKGKKPTRTIVKLNGKKFVRLAVAGLATRAQADQLCQSIRASGSQCFVRGSTVAPLPVQYATRKPAKAGPKLAAKPATVKVAFKDTKPGAKKVVAAQPAAKANVKVAVKPQAQPTKIAAR